MWVKLAKNDDKKSVSIFILESASKKHSIFDVPSAILGIFGRFLGEKISLFTGEIHILVVCFFRCLLEEKGFR